MPRAYTTGFLAGAAALAATAFVPPAPVLWTLALSTAIGGVAFCAGAFFSGE